MGPSYSPYPPPLEGGGGQKSLFRLLNTCLDLGDLGPLGLTGSWAGWAVTAKRDSDNCDRCIRDLRDRVLGARGRHQDPQCNPPDRNRSLPPLQPGRQLSCADEID
jgi:hypothetical protein